MSENTGLKVSCTTDMSPTAIFYRCPAAACRRLASAGGRGVPGVVGGRVGPGGCYTGTQPVPVPGPILVYI